MYNTVGWSREKGRGHQQQHKNNKHRDSRKLHILKIGLEIHCLMERKGLQLGCLLFYGHAQQFIVPVAFLLLQLQQIQQAVFYLREVVADNHSCLFIRYNLADSVHFGQGHGNIITQHKKGNDKIQPEKYCPDNTAEIPKILQQ